MITKWDATKSVAGAILILSILTSSIYMSDYRKILDENPSKDLILLEYSDDRLDFLARSAVPEVEFLRWRFDNGHTIIYFGNNKVGDSFYQLRCYYDLNGKKGYRNIVQKQDYPITYEVRERCIEQGKEYSVGGDSNLMDHCEVEEAVTVVQRIDYYRDSRHNTRIGQFLEQTELYPLTGKVSVSFIPDEEDMPCQLIWRVDSLDEMKSVFYKKSSWIENESTYLVEYDNSLSLDWSDAKDQVSWARQYATGKLYVAYTSTRGDQFIDPIIQVDGINVDGDMLIMGSRIINMSIEGICCRQSSDVVTCVDKCDGDCNNYCLPGQSCMVCENDACKLQDDFYRRHRSILKGVRLN